MKDIFILILSLIIMSSCKEKHTEEQILVNQNKKVIDSLTYIRHNLHPEYLKSGNSELIADEIIKNSFSVLEIDSKNLDAVKDLAHFNFEIKNYKEAVHYYTILIDLKDDLNNRYVIPYYLQRGIAKFHLQDFNGAIEDLQHYKDENIDKRTNGYTEACYYLGTCYKNVNDQSNACDNFRTYAENVATDEAWDLIAEYCN
ncbi:hypothetical protein VUJ46_12190 [Chryseobacterium sp. MYb264]|uniref:hypothetical protein n=1 Tax=Chryseobacterium sp. MYb264 TaxID=2745153 RepID=UPI002E0FEB9A|nr:hypothetical protein VUJ46_12190 [Chryseobacterium sp. MYb264]